MIVQGVVTLQKHSFQKYFQQAAKIVKSCDNAILFPIGIVLAAPPLPEHPHRKRASGDRRTVWVIACLATVCVLLLALDAWSLWRSHERRLQEAGRTAANMAQAVARQADDALTATDLALAYVVRRVEGDLDRDDFFGDLGEALAARAASLPQVAELFVFDEAGAWVANSLRIMPRDANSAAAPYFIHHRDHPGPEAFIGPSVKSRINGEWVMTVSRRISRPDGAFAGVAAATIPLSYFRDSYAGLDLGASGVIALLRESGALLMRHPFIESAADANAAGSTLFQAYLKRPAQGLLRERSPVDGIERLYAYRHSDRYPIVATAALSYDALFAPWNDDALLHGAVLLVLALLAAAGAGSYLVQQRRLRLLAQRHRASERRLGDLADNLPLLALRLDADHRMNFCNTTGRAWLTIAAVAPVTANAPMAPATTTSMHLADAAGPVLYAQWRPMIERALAGERVAFDCVALLNGQARSLRMVCMPDRAQDAAARGVVMLGSDITELKAGERRMHAIAANSPALLAFVDMDQRFTYSNGRGDAAPGIDTDEMVGRTVQEVYGGTVYSLLESHLRAALGGEAVQFDYSVDQGGERRVLHNTYIPERDAAGRVTGFIMLTDDVTMFKEAEQKLSRLARYDALTGLPNRSHLCERLADALRRGDRSGRALALIRIDITRFREINDVLGHLGGDAVLKEVAARLVRSCRTTDTAARLGDDEFVILMEGLADPDESRLVAAKLMETLSRPFEVAGGTHHLTVTLGIALRHGEAVDADTLLRQAGDALRQAKQAASGIVVEAVI
jgi:diguanylate cyclase (GGDEF)-like protein/PAS domain S-box-containing protein